MKNFLKPKEHSKPLFYSLWFLIILFAVIYPLFSMMAYHKVLPRNDMFINVVPIFLQLKHHQLNFIQFIEQLFSPYNSHRMVLFRLLFLYQFMYLPKLTVFPLLVGYILTLAIMMMLLKMFFDSSNLKLSNNTKLILLFALVAILFNPINYYLWISPNTFDKLLNAPLTILALFSIAFKRKSLWLIISLMLLAALTSSNSLVIWPVMVVAFIYMGYDWRKVLAVLLVGVVVSLLYHHGQHLQSFSFHEPLKSFFFFFMAQGQIFRFVYLPIHERLIIQFLSGIAIFLFMILLMSRAVSMRDKLKSDAFFTACVSAVVYFNIILLVASFTRFQDGWYYNARYNIIISLNMLVLVMGFFRVFQHSSAIDKWFFKASYACLFIYIAIWFATLVTDLASVPMRKPLLESAMRHKVFIIHTKQYIGWLESSHVAKELVQYLHFVDFQYSPLNEPKANLSLQASSNLRSVRYHSRYSTSQEGIADLKKHGYIIANPLKGDVDIKPTNTFKIALYSANKQFCGYGWLDSSYLSNYLRNKPHWVKFEGYVFSKKQCRTIKYAVNVKG